MQPSLPPSGELPNLSHGAQLSRTPFANLQLWTYQISCRACAVGRGEGLGRQVAPAVLFRVSANEGDGGREGGLAARRGEPLRCPEVLVKLIRSPTGSAEADGVMAGVMNYTCEYLRDACAFLKASMQRGTGAGNGSQGGGGGGDHGKEGAVVKTPPSNDEVVAGFPYFSSTGTDACGRAEHVRSHERQSSPAGTLLFKSSGAPVYSSEDGMSTLPVNRIRHLNDDTNRSSVSNLQEARAILQIIMGTAFSCPCETLAKAFQLIIANELEQSISPFGTCCGILKFLSPLGAAPRSAKKEVRGDENISYLYFLNGVQTTSNLADALSSSNGTGEEVKWYVTPSLAAALPTLMQSLTGGLSEVLEELQLASERGDGVVAATGTSETTALVRTTSSTDHAVSSSSRRRGLTLSSNKIVTSTASKNDAKNTEKGTTESSSKQTPWDALCRSSLSLPKSVLRDRSDLLYMIFFEMVEVPQYYHALSICPEVLRAHHSTFQYIFFGDGSLPICERLMIALMAASRQKCEYLFSCFAALLLQFSEQGESGESVAESWLLDGPPPKLQAFQRFISIATLVPWKMTLDEIHKVKKAGWSIPCLIQASCIVAETLSLCSFVMGLFIPNDIRASITLPPSLMNALSSSPGPGEIPHHRSRVDFVKYTGVDNIVSENRIKGSSNSFILSETFNWHEHGCTVMEQYYPGAAALINNELDAFSAVTRKLNYSDCVGLTTPEYSPSYAFGFLRMYVQNIMGFAPGDYPYNTINKVLRRPAKLIAQSCTMRPQTLLCSQMRLWVQDSGVSSSSSVGVSSGGELQSVEESTRKTTEQLEQPKLGMTEQEQQLVVSLTTHQAPFTLSLPGTDSGRREKPREEIVKAALRLHEERLIFLVVLATMEARKEGLLALLLYPMWELLNNM